MGSGQRGLQQGEREERDCGVCAGTRWQRRRWRRACHPDRAALHRCMYGVVNTATALSAHLPSAVGHETDKRRWAQEHATLPGAGLRCPSAVGNAQVVKVRLSLQMLNGCHSSSAAGSRRALQVLARDQAAPQHSSTVPNAHCSAISPAAPLCARPSLPTAWVRQQEPFRPSGHRQTDRRRRNSSAAERTRLLRIPWRGGGSSGGIAAAALSFPSFPTNKAAWRICRRCTRRPRSSS